MSIGTTESLLKPCQLILTSFELEIDDPTCERMAVKCTQACSSVIGIIQRKTVST